MESIDIINSLNKYKNEEFETVFLNEIIAYFKDKKTITKIFENDFMLAGIRIHILYNKFYFYLSPKKNSKRVCYRQLNLSKNQAYNLQNQLAGIKKNTFHICDKVNAGSLKSFLIISSVPIKEEKNNELHKDLILSLLGVNSLKFLEYQNLDNYCKLWNKSEKNFNEIAKLKIKIKKLSWQEQDRILMFGSIIYQFLGTIFTEDVNLIIIEKNDNDTKLKDEFKGFKHIYISEKNYDADKYYKVQWVINKLPILVGAPDIYTMLIDTKYHFNFMGLKCISIFANIERSIDKSSWYSFLDIYLLKIINKLDCMNKLCIKNIAFKHGKSVINTNSSIKDMYNNINKFAKKSYGIDIPISYIKEHFEKCSNKFDTIYKNKVKYISPLVREQIKVHRKISQHYIMKYGKYKESLLDMGSGKLSGAYIYNMAKIKTVYGVEPSSYSIQAAQETANKISNVNFHLIQAFADKPLNIQVKFDIITFIFTIHYMIKNIDVVIDNIKKTSKKGTVIIITCINGDKVLEKLNKVDKYEIKYRGEIYWGVYKFNTPEKYLFYMKEVYGVEMGSEEYLSPISKIIKKFQKNAMKLIYSNDFKSEYTNIPNSKKLHNYQYDILNMQQILIFTTT